ncbi:MAG: rod shape-determining protein MreD [Eubacteriales bacterium]|nr:rod shape-determining protein MreD [Eubacteriales bacterium]
MKIKKLIKRELINIVLILVCFLLQTCVFPFNKVLTTEPNLLLFCVFSFGFIYGPVQGMFCGLLSGLFMDLFYTNVPFGFFMLLYIIVGFVNGLFTNFYYDDYLTLPVILCIASELVFNAGMILFKYLQLGHINVWSTIINTVFPEVLFSVLLTLLFYRVLLKANRIMDIKEDKRGQNVA